MGKIALGFVAGAAFLLTVAMLLTAGWTAPPIHSVQGGYRGTGMDELSTPASERLLALANALPDPIDKASPDGDKATAVYKNVQVLTDLSADQFNRVMLGLAAWVACTRITPGPSSRPLNGSVLIAVEPFTASGWPNPLLVVANPSAVDVAPANQILAGTGMPRWQV